jgi:amidohydrolase
MSLLEEIEALRPEIAAIRRDLHAHPETAFEEVRTAECVAAELARHGIAVSRGLAKTGVVGSLSAGSSTRAIALRADMDALHIEEANAFAHRSRHAGKMHACGHDGHTAMLLGAARYLAATRRFDGTVHFIFQPAEENEGGGRVMVEEGLFEKFPCEAVFGMHNIPGIPIGRFGVAPGPMMASFDIFEIAVTGRGTHAAMPHTGADPIVAGTALVQSLQTIVSRNVAPLDAAVVSVTQFNSGDTWNVIPNAATIRGTTRVFRAEVRDAVEAAMRRICQGIAATYGVDVALRYERRYPPTVNSRREAEIAAEVLVALVGAECVNREPQPLMAAEDFAFMLLAKPGCYVWLGNGTEEGGCMVHNPNYDFNDAAIPYGVAYWVRLVEHLLSASSHA